MSLFDIKKNTDEKAAQELAERSEDVSYSRRAQMRAQFGIPVIINAHLTVYGAIGALVRL